MNDEQGKIRRLELESANRDKLALKEIENLGNLAVSNSLNTTPTTIDPPIIQLARNTDHSHSVDTWYNSVSAANNQTLEAAEVYTHAPGSILLGKNNSKTSGADVNDALKDSAHSHFAANIQDPRWDKAAGIVRLGSTNTLDYFLGTYAEDGTTFIPSRYGIEAGRPLNVILKIAKAHAGVKPKGTFYAGIYNNAADKLEYLPGDDFVINATVNGTPAATASTKFQVIAETDRGFTYVSNILTVADAPSLTSFVSNRVETALSWTAIPAVRLYKLYRQVGSGNVELLEVITSGANRTKDNNTPARIDTNSTSFPVISGETKVRSIMGTLLNALDDLATDGAGAWQLLRFVIPMPSVLSLASAELVLRLGLTQPCALEVTAATNGTANVSSASAFFDSGKHAGKTVKIRDLTNAANQLTTTVSSVTDANNIVLADAPGWTSATNILEIEAGEPHGLVLDLVGLSFNEGTWSPHFDDNNQRPQNPASQPVGSSQGPVGGTDEPVYGGGIRCFAWYNLATEFCSRARVLANDLHPGMALYNGTEFPSVISKVKRDTVHSLYRVVTKDGKRSPLVTLTHRFLRALSDAETGIRMSDFCPGENVLRFESNKFIVDTVESIEKVDFPHGILIVSLEMIHDPENKFCQLFLLSDPETLDEFENHNLKDSNQFEQPVYNY